MKKNIGPENGSDDHKTCRRSCFFGKVCGYKFITDMPIESGGKDKDPSPADLLVASLESCLAMHMALYGKTVGLSCAGLKLNLVYNIAEETGKKG